MLYVVRSNMFRVVWCIYIYGIRIVVIISIIMIVIIYFFFFSYFFFRFSVLSSSVVRSRQWYYNIYIWCLFNSVSKQGGAVVMVCRWVYVAAISLLLLTVKELYRSTLILLRSTFYSLQPSICVSLSAFTSSLLVLAHHYKSVKYRVLFLFVRSVYSNRRLVVVVVYRTKLTNAEIATAVGTRKSRACPPWMVLINERFWGGSRPLSRGIDI